MNHSIFIGSFAVLEKRWIEAVLELRREDALDEINVLVGSNVLAAYLKRRMAGSGHAVANVRFHTFLDLAQRVAAGSGSLSGNPRIPDLGTSVVLEKILAERTPDVFNPLSKFPGFRDTLLETFRDLRDAEVTPGMLRTAVGRLGIPKGRRPHLDALADLYRRYREQVEQFHDDDDDFRDAISGCRPDFSGLGRYPLMVYGVYDVTGRQARFLSALKSCIPMTYFIPFVDSAVSEFARPFLARISADLGAKPVVLQEPEPESDLERLAAKGFGLAAAGEQGERDALSSDGSYALVSVPGESRLAVEIVREIVRAVRDGTIGGFHEAAVVLRQPESDIPVLSEMLRLRGIPYYIHGGTGFAERLLSRAVVAVIELVSNGCTRESILAAMELVAASLPEPEASQWDVPTWKALTNDARFLSGIRAWDSGIDAMIGKMRYRLENREDEQARDEEEESRSDAMAAEALQAAQSLKAAWKLFRSAVADWPRELPWREWAAFLHGRLEPLMGAAEDWPDFSDVLDRIGNLDAVSRRPVPLDGLKTALVRSMRLLKRPEGRFQRSGVNILSATAARGLRFPLVILPGLDEGRFPAKLRQDPLLLDAERLHFENLPLKKKRFEEERLLFDMAARSAMKRAVLMTSRLEEASDRERIPSQFFLRAAAAVRGRLVTLRDLNPETVPGFRSVSLDNPAPAAGEDAVDEAEVRMRLIVSGPHRPQAALSALSRLDPLRFERPLSFDGARSQRSLTPCDGLIRDPRLVQWMAGTLPSAEGQVSASRLEAYAKCPYYYFLKYGIGLEAWEEPADAALEIDPLERGLAVHSVLEGFLKGRGEDAFDAPAEQLRRSLESMTAEILERRRPAGIADLLWEIERDTLSDLLGNWLTFEMDRVAEGLRPSGFELVFGRFPDADPNPAFCVDAGEHRFEFRGRIDRVDVSPDGTRARVIDYKTGMRPYTMGGRSRSELMGGERIQLAVYRGALSVLEGFREVPSVQGEYLFLQPRDGRIVPSAFSEEELDRAAGLLPGILEILGDGMKSGVFFARTSGRLRPAGHCDYCDYLAVCGKDRIQREERKADDPRVQNFLKITEIG